LDLRVTVCPDNRVGVTTAEKIVEAQGCSEALAATGM
jgi:hypothetical protein